MVIISLVTALTAPKTLNLFRPEGEQINVLIKHPTLADTKQK